MAILNRTQAKADAVVEDIRQAGGEAIGISCDVLDKASVEKAAVLVSETFGICDILINGAGGNHPSGTTSKETLEMGDLLNKDESVRTFFDLATEGFDYVFRLNVMGTLIPTQVFAAQMAGRPGANDY